MVFGRINHHGIQSTAVRELLILLIYAAFSVTHDCSGPQVYNIWLASLQYRKYSSLWYMLYDYG